MIVWRGALARTGGTVCQAVAEEMLRAEGRAFKELTVESLQALPQSAWSRGDYVGGSDGFFSPAFSDPAVRVIFVRRDPRDALASFVRLTQAPPTHWMNFLNSFCRLYDDFLTLPEQSLLVLDYETEVKDLERLTRRLAPFFGCQAGEAQVKEIVACLSRDTVKKRLAADAARSLELLRGAVVDKGAETITLRLEGEAVTFSKDLLHASTRRDLDAGKVYDWILDFGAEGLVRLANNRDGTVRFLSSSALEKTPYRLFNAGHVRDRGGEADPFSPSPGDKAQLTALIRPFLDRHGFL